MCSAATQTNHFSLLCLSNSGYLRYYLLDAMRVNNAIPYLGYYSIIYNGRYSGARPGAYFQQFPFRTAQTIDRIHSVRNCATDTAQAAQASI